MPSTTSHLELRCHGRLVGRVNCIMHRYQLHILDMSAMCVRGTELFYDF